MIYKLNGNHFLISGMVIKDAKVKYFGSENKYCCAEASVAINNKAEDPKERYMTIQGMFTLTKLVFVFLSLLPFRWHSETGLLLCYF